MTLRMPAARPDAPKGKLATLLGLPPAIANRTFGVKLVVEGDLFTTEPVALRVVLLAGNEQVGQAGMAIGAELDRATGVLKVAPRAEANVGLMLTRDDCASIRVVVQDPDTDAVLDQSDEIPVKLGIPT